MDIWFWFWYFFYCFAGGTLWHLQNSYNISNISFLNSLPPPFSFILPFRHSWSSLNRYHFSIYIHMCAVFGQCTLPHPFLNYSPTSHSYHPLIQDIFCPLFSDFLKEKKWHFCLFKIAEQGVSLWHSMYICIITQIGSSPPFFSFLP
jgi:hypothetical protein